MADSRGGRRLYHHGDLRNALLEAALTLIAEKGPKGFSLTEAARLAGVSAAAPYRHFTDREALLAALALRGTALLHERLQTAVTGARGAYAQLLAGGRAYVAFAREQRAYFLTLFGADVDKDRFPELLEAIRAALAVAGAVVAHLPDDTVPAARRAELPAELWALCHGVAALVGDGGFERMAGGRQPEVIVEALLTQYWRGLGLDGSSP